MSRRKPIDCQTRPEDDAPHPSAERRPLNNLDTFLRSFGWRIWRRPLRGEPVWRHRDGRELPQSVVVAECDFFVNAVAAD